MFLLWEELEAITRRTGGGRHLCARENSVVCKVKVGEGTKCDLVVNPALGHEERDFPDSRISSDVRTVDSVCRSPGMLRTWPGVLQLPVSLERGVHTEGHIVALQTQAYATTGANATRVISKTPQLTPSSGLARLGSRRCLPKTAAPLFGVKRDDGTRLRRSTTPTN
jgi:hypothetical protein